MRAFFHSVDVEFTFWTRDHLIITSPEVLIDLSCWYSLITPLIRAKVCLELTILLMTGDVFHRHYLITAEFLKGTFELEGLVNSLLHKLVDSEYRRVRLPISTVVWALLTNS